MLQRVVKSWKRGTSIEDATVCCSVLQYVVMCSVCCSVLQFIAVCCKGLEARHSYGRCQGVLQCVLQYVLHYVVVCCSVLQFVAVYCSVL